jgi:hypothetical protein
VNTIPQGVSKMLGTTTAASFPHQTKEQSSNQYLSANCFRGTAEKRVDHSTADFCLWYTKTSSVLSSNWQWRLLSPAHFWCRSHPREPLKAYNIHDQTCPCLHWFRWRIFWASVVNCNLKSNKNLTVTKFWACAVNVSCQL